MTPTAKVIESNWYSPVKIFIMDVLLIFFKLNNSTLGQLKKAKQSFMLLRRKKVH
jgi:hypothetical protein